MLGWARPVGRAGPSGGGLQWPAPGGSRLAKCRLPPGPLLHYVRLPNEAQPRGARKPRETRDGRRDCEPPLSGGASRARWPPLPHSARPHPRPANPPNPHNHYHVPPAVLRAKGCRQREIATTIFFLSLQQLAACFNFFELTAVSFDYKDKAFFFSKFYFSFNMPPNILTSSLKEIR